MLICGLKHKLGECKQTMIKEIKLAEQEVKFNFRNEIKLQFLFTISI
jgi:hypothetical protein